MILKHIKEVGYHLIREDGRLERFCNHGCGHTVGHTRGYLKGRTETIHGCCGCCSDYPIQEIRADRGQ